MRPKLPAADDEYTQQQRRILDAQLAEGMADVRAGRVRGPFSTYEEFIIFTSQGSKEVEPQENQTLGVMKLLRTPHFERNYAEASPASPTRLRQAVVADAILFVTVCCGSPIGEAVTRCMTSHAVLAGIAGTSPSRLDIESRAYRRVVGPLGPA